MFLNYRILFALLAIVSAASLSARGGGERGGDDRMRDEQMNRNVSRDINHPRTMPRAQTNMQNRYVAPRNYDANIDSERNVGNSYEVKANPEFNVNSPRAIDNGRPVENAALRRDLNEGLYNNAAEYGGYVNGVQTYPQQTYPNTYPTNPTQNLEVDTSNPSDTNSNPNSKNPAFSLERPGYDPNANAPN